MLIVERAECLAEGTEYLRCPVCGRGRLCDRPSVEEVVVARDGASSLRLPHIILKCPKCASKISIGYK